MLYTFGSLGTTKNESSICATVLVCYLYRIAMHVDPTSGLQRQAINVFHIYTQQYHTVIMIFLLVTWTGSLFLAPDPPESVWDDAVVGADDGSIFGLEAGREARQSFLLTFTGTLPGAGGTESEWP